MHGYNLIRLWPLHAQNVNELLCTAERNGGLIGAVSAVDGAVGGGVAGVRSGDVVCGFSGDVNDLES